MGAAKGEPQDEEVPTPTKEAGEPSVEGEKQRSGSLFTFVKSIKHPSFNVFCVI